jgi:hypothetical protein
MKDYWVDARTLPGDVTEMLISVKKPSPQYLVRAESASKALMLAQAYLDGAHWAVEASTRRDIIIA